MCIIHAIVFIILWFQIFFFLHRKYDHVEEVQPFGLTTECPMQCHSCRIIGWLELEGAFKGHFVLPPCDKHGSPMHLWRNSRFSWVSKWKSKEKNPDIIMPETASSFSMSCLETPQMLCTPEDVQVRGKSSCLPPSGTGPVLSALTAILLVSIYKLSCLGNILHMAILLPHVAENSRNIRNFSLVQG